LAYVVQAPIQKKRTSVRAKAAKAAKPPVAASATASIDAPLLPSTKRDKRTIKHATFMNKIEKATTKKRRRPNKKLVANLESLADALPDFGEDEGKTEVVIGQAKIQRTSLKSRPGAMKRKEKLEKMEKDRFNQNLVQMAASSSTTTSAGTIADRWAALKNHVQSTAEKKPEFIKA
jgi:hypothetical protein